MQFRETCKMEHKTYQVVANMYAFGMMTEDEKGRGYVYKPTKCYEFY